MGAVMKPDEVIAVTALRRWAWERGRLRRGAVAIVLPQLPGRQRPAPRSALREAALIRCIDFERVYAVLTDEQQALLSARYVEGLPDRITAQLLDLTPAQVFRRLEIARLRLASLLDRADLLT